MALAATSGATCLEGVQSYGSSFPQTTPYSCGCASAIPELSENTDVPRDSQLALTALAHGEAGVAWRSLAEGLRRLVPLRAAQDLLVTLLLLSCLRRCWLLKDWVVPDWAVREPRCVA